MHYYPQGGEFTDDVSTAKQLLRNQSTRSLWDPNYIDQTWINDKVQLIPRLRNWVNTYYYPGTPIAITEYNWGAEAHINGATTQADILGIFGRENLDMAARWTTPDATTPTYKAIKMYRNYDGALSAFGDVSVAATVVNPDGAIASYQWNFGDGATGSGVSASHTYSIAGSYAALLTVTDNLGATGTTSIGITVSANPNVVNAPSNLTGSAGRGSVTLKWTD